MPLPSSTGLSSLDYVYLGAPFVTAQSSSLDTASVDVVYLASPFVSAPTAPPPARNIYVKVNGAWVESTNIYTKVDGAWKQGYMYGNVAGVWKS